MNYLDKICRYKKDELESAQRRQPLAELRARANDVEPARDFYAALTSSDGEPRFIIAEVKKASPSRGIIVEDFDPLRIAHMYEDNGAAAISVLTDEHFFQGDLVYLKQIRQHVKLPLLRKDFTLNEYHIYEARAAAADAVLLIARILEPSQLWDYRDLAQELGMSVLIEVHSRDELDEVLAGQSEDCFRASLLGVNNRNLTTFETDLAVSEQLAAHLSMKLPLVAESGIHEREDIERLEKAGIRVFLIGESLLVASDPANKLRELLGHGAR